jgi:hypothetical protein
MVNDTTELVTYIENYLYEEIDVKKFREIQSIKDEDEVFKYLFPNYQALFDKWGEQVVMEEFYEPFQQWEHNMYLALK